MLFYLKKMKHENTQKSNENVNIDWMTIGFRFVLYLYGYYQTIQTPFQDFFLPCFFLLPLIDVPLVDAPLFLFLLVLFFQLQLNQ